MGDVFDIRPKPSGLLGLPSCPIKACSKCGRDDAGWISAKYGCAGCAPEMDGPTNEISHWSSRASLLESALVYVLRAAGPSRAIDEIMANHMLRVDGDQVVVVLPEGDK